MNRFCQLLEKYDRLVIFDTETTGLQWSRDEIIEFAAVTVEAGENGPVVSGEYDQLVALSPGGFVPEAITKLTGLTSQDLRERGLSKERVCRDISEIISGNSLLIAYNAHFDLSFLYYFLLRSGDPDILRGKDKLDLLTVYRDRRPYPHRLLNAIEAYGLGGKVRNSHRALDDVYATLAVMEAMDAEKQDLVQYVDLFGYIPKFGCPGKPIGSVTYRPQTGGRPLYEEGEIAHV